MPYVGQTITEVFPTSISVDSATISGNTTIGGTLGVTGVSTLSDNIVFGASGKGVHLGVTSATASNLVDDYEEGTWTPTLTASKGSRQGTWSSLVGRYIKVGHTVFLTVSITGSGMYFSHEHGYQQIAGMPFAADMSQSGSQPYAGSWTAGSVTHSNAGTVYLHSTSMYMHSPASNVNTAGSGGLGVTISYFTA